LKKRKGSFVWGLVAEVCEDTKPRRRKGGFGLFQASGSYEGEGDALRAAARRRKGRVAGEAERGAPGISLSLTGKESGGVKNGGGGKFISPNSTGSSKETWEGLESPPQQRGQRRGFQKGGRMHLKRDDSPRNLTLKQTSE